MLFVVLLDYVYGTLNLSDINSKFRIVATCVVVWKRPFDTQHDPHVAQWLISGRHQTES
jgi:hypothetical protein